MISITQNLKNFYPKMAHLQSQPDFQIPRINTTLKGTESVRYFGSVIWNNIPIKIGSIKDFITFKTEFRK